MNLTKGHLCIDCSYIWAGVEASVLTRRHHVTLHLDIGDDMFADIWAHVDIGADVRTDLWDISLDP